LSNFGRVSQLQLIGKSAETSEFSVYLRFFVLEKKHGQDNNKMLQKAKKCCLLDIDNVIFITKLLKISHFIKRTK
jgi:hypothetical protein